MSIWGIEDDDKGSVEELMKLHVILWEASWERV